MGVAKLHWPGQRARHAFLPCFSAGELQEDSKVTVGADAKGLTFKVTSDPAAAAARSAAAATNSNSTAGVKRAQMYVEEPEDEDDDLMDE